MTVDFPAPCAPTTPTTKNSEFVSLRKALRLSDTCKFRHIGVSGSPLSWRDSFAIVGSTTYVGGRGSELRGGGGGGMGDTANKHFGNSPTFVFYCILHLYYQILFPPLTNPHTPPPTYGVVES